MIIYSLFKHFITISFLVLIIQNHAVAQTPNQFKYQAILRDNMGAIIKNEEVIITIDILDSSPTGSSVFEETHNVFTNSQGLINLNVGAIEDLNILKWNENTYFIKIKINGSLMGVSQLLAVPYAINSKYAETTDYNNLSNKPEFKGWDIDESDDFTGDYNMLTNKPTLILDISGLSDSLELLFSKDYNELNNRPDYTNWDMNIHDDFSGDYNDLINSPNLIEDISSLTDSLNILFSKNFNDLINRPDFTNWDTSFIDDFSGDYNDLLNRPLDISAFNNDLGYLTNHSDTSSSNEIQNLMQVLNENNDAGNQPIKNLANPEEEQDAATKSYVDLLIKRIVDLEILAFGVKDYDGYTYKVTKIGNQYWMAENLRTTHFADGVQIQLIQDSTEWKGHHEAGYCYYNNELNANGALYNWYAATYGSESSSSNPSGVQGVCPDDWHLPSYAEWQELRDYLNINGNAGEEANVLKTKSGWDEGGNGNDKYGFSAQPGGYRFGDDGEFIQKGKYGFWWTSKEFDDNTALFQFMGYLHNVISLNKDVKNDAFSIRCVRD